MKLRRTASALFASLLLAGTVAASANAATTAAKPKPMAMAHKTAAKSTKKPMPMASRGGDAQNGAVDQLNAQSLQRAQTNPPTQ